MNRLTVDAVKINLYDILTKILPSKDAAMALCGPLADEITPRLNALIAPAETPATEDRPTEKVMVRVPIDGGGAVYTDGEPIEEHDHFEIDYEQHCEPCKKESLVLICSKCGCEASSLQGCMCASCRIALARPPGEAGSGDAKVATRIGA